MGYIADETIAAFKGVYNLGLFFRMLTSPSLHLWGGITDITIPTASIDAAGQVYNGAGALLDVPDALEVLINGTAARVDWEMSGLTPEMAIHIAEQAPSVLGARVDLAIAAMDERWQLVGPLISIWVGTADFVTETQPRQADQTKPRLRKLILATVTGDSSRSLAHGATWTDIDQKTISASDDFCHQVSRYYPGLQITWPRF